MSIINKLAKMPFVGNIVPSSYVIKSSLFSKTVACWSIRVFNNTVGGNELIVTETELANAKIRFAANASEVKKTAYGHFSEETITSSNKNKKKLKTNLIYLFGSTYGTDLDSDAGPTGYMFSSSELKDIEERTKRLTNTVVRPTLWQKFVMWWAGIFCNVKVKG